MAKICESQSQISCKLQTAHFTKFSAVLILHPEAPSLSTKQQRVGIFNKHHCICVFFFVPLAYMFPQLNHIFAAHCEIFIGKSKWAGRQLARASFLVVSRYNLDISRFDLDHNLQNICFKYFTHTRYTSNSLPGGEFYQYQRYSLRCFNDFFSSNSQWQ